MKYVIQIPGVKNEHLFILDNIKAYDQYLRAVDNLINKSCPFCEPVNRELNKIEFENDSCWVQKSVFPQKHHEYHFLIVYRDHLKDPLQRTEKHKRDYAEAEEWLFRKYRFLGGAISMRFGDVAFHCGSVADHLHVNVQVPNREGAVSVIIAKSKNQLKTQRAIVAVFEKLRLGTNYEDLSEVDKKKIKGRYPKLDP
jgi:hypothetical protein